MIIPKQFVDLRKFKEWVELKMKFMKWGFNCEAFEVRVWKKMVKATMAETGVCFWSEKWG